MGTETREMKLTTMATNCAPINFLGRYAEDELTTDDTDGHGNAGDEVNDNSDNLRPNQ